MDNMKKIVTDVKKSEDEASSGGLETVFQAFAKCDNKESDGKSISCKNVKNWLKQANILDDKILMDDDIDKTFCMVAKSKDRMTMTEFQEMVNKIAGDKKLDKKEILEKLTSCGKPDLAALKEAVAGGLSGSANVSSKIGKDNDNKSKCDKK